MGDINPRDLMFFFIMSELATVLCSVLTLQQNIDLEIVQTGVTLMIESSGNMLLRKMKGSNVIYPIEDVMGREWNRFRSRAVVLKVWSQDQ